MCLRFLFLSALLFTQTTVAQTVQQPRESERQAIQEALDWVSSVRRVEAEYQYVMTASVRLLLFWVSRDDVGEGYVRRGYAEGDSNLSSIELLIGSDPLKAPFGINKWGAAIEMTRHRSGPNTPTASAFFGFMKDTQGQTMSEMRTELAMEKVAGRYFFKGILERLDPGRSIWIAAPYFTDEDYCLRDLKRATNSAFEQLSISTRSLKIHATSDGCRRLAGFLSTVLELMDATLAGHRPPLERCYILGKRSYSLSLTNLTFVPKENVRVYLRTSPGRLERTYSELLEAQFCITNPSSGARYRFSLLYGAAGGMRGIPVQIRYQPHWWFKMVLNLKSTNPAIVELAAQR